MNLNYPSLVSSAFLCASSLCSSPTAYAVPPSEPCSLLTQAQVSAALGVEVEAAQHIAPTLCQWSAPNQPNSINGKKLCSPFQTSVHGDTPRLQS
jgi:hypothetical protein